MVLFIIAALASVIGVGIGVYWCVDYVKKLVPTIAFKKLLTRLMILVGGTSIMMVTMFCSIYLWAKISPKPHEMVCTIIGGLLFSVTALICLYSFILHYYVKPTNKEIKLDKILFIILMVLFPLMFVFIFLLSEGFANYLVYPLPNGINFTQGFVTPTKGSANITFYALCILSGAVYVYLLCDHKFYIQYGKHGVLESTFFVAFPAGIIGARIFYVIGQFSSEFLPRFQDGEWWSIFAIWEGGLTILGGAITGIAVGVAWFMWRNKGYNIFYCIDIIVPTILIAQAVGRWGNYFNCEVHGVLTDVEYWKWLPTVIWKNMTYSSVNGFAPTGKMYVPLFLIEGIVNFLGYFVLAHLFGHPLRKYTEYGDLAFGYIIWYGLTRVFMEPLRDTAFNMGADGYWSWVWSMMFVLVGSLAIAGNHLIRYLINKKEALYSKKLYLISVIAFGVVGLILLITGAILMTTNPFVLSIAFNGFNIGLILLVLGVATLSMEMHLLPKYMRKVRHA